MTLTPQAVEEIKRWDPALAGALRRALPPLPQAPLLETVTGTGSRYRVSGCSHRKIISPVPLPKTAPEPKVGLQRFDLPKERWLRRDGGPRRQG